MFFQMLNHELFFWNKLVPAKFLLQRPLNSSIARMIYPVNTVLLFTDTRQIYIHRTWLTIQRRRKSSGTLNCTVFTTNASPRMCTQPLFHDAKLRTVYLYLGLVMVVVPTMPPHLLPNSNTSSKVARRSHT